MNKGLQHKMLNYEVTPPPNTWNKIAAALDESNLENEFPSALYNLEVKPPSTIWDKITTTLDEDATSTFHQKRKVVPFLRYAVAASIIGLIAFGTIKLINGKNAGKNLAKITNPSIDSNAKASKENNTTPANNVAIPDETRDNLALEESKHTIAKLDLPVNRGIKQRVINNIPSPIDPVSTNKINPELLSSLSGLEQPVVSSNGDIINRYVMLMTPDGNLIRMSKKWGNLLCCVSGEEQDEDCKDQMKKWRDKIANSSVAPSPGNFMDILSLVNSLQD